jgi:hypothetical protein
MQTLPSNMPPSGQEKFFRALPFILIAIAGFYFYGQIIHWVQQVMQDTFWSIVYGIGIFLLITTLWQYHDFLWSGYKIIMKKVEGFFIKMDPLSFMDRYADILTDKLRNLQKAKLNIAAERNDLIRVMKEDQKSLEDNLQKAKAAKQQGAMQRAAAYATEAQQTKESLELYRPNLERMNRSLEFMNAMDENWTLSIDQIRKFNERKRREYKILKKNAAALNQAEEFLSDKTEEAQRYKRSVQIAQEQMAQRIAYIEEFEAKAKPILEGAKIEKTMQENEGMDLLAQYMNEGKLTIPDFTTIDVPQDQYQITNNTDSNNKYNF